MKTTRLAQFFFIALLAPLTHAGASDLTVRVQGLRSGAGKLLLSVFKGDDGFPDQPEKAERISRVDAKTGVVTVTFAGLPEGDYAIAFIHDENKNGQLDTNSLGFPKEGLGFSNDPRLTFGPPSFAQTKFHLGAADMTISPTMKYY